MIATLGDGPWTLVIGDREIPLTSLKTTDIRFMHVQEKLDYLKQNYPQLCTIYKAMLNLGGDCGLLDEHGTQRFHNLLHKFNKLAKCQGADFYVKESIDGGMCFDKISASSPC